MGLPAQVGYDVVIAGHLHGGHISISGIREYILKEHFATVRYSKGEYKLGKSTMYLSAGIAKKVIFSGF